MKKFILKTIGDYTLVHLPTNSVTPYCVAWLYDSEHNCWGQGHYFCDYKSAVAYFKDSVKKSIDIMFEDL